MGVLGGFGFIFGCFLADFRFLGPLLIFLITVVLECTMRFVVRDQMVRFSISFIGMR